MRLADFLIALLQAHGAVLQRLAALFGEDVLVEALEQAGDSPAARALESSIEIEAEPQWLDTPGPGDSSSAYAMLEDSVHEMKLPSQLEFHVWAYPHYRAFIESALDLTSRIRGPSHHMGSEAGTALVEEAVAQAEAWVRTLPLPPDLAKQAREVSHVPWLRFRTEMLKKIGKRPLGPVY